MLVGHRLHEGRKPLTQESEPAYNTAMAGFTKLWSTIIHSTIWREEMHVKVVWITMLAMADRNGCVSASIPGLADAARVSLNECQDALRRLSGPDIYSRTKENDGRRIEEIDGGWQLLNYGKYRAVRDEEVRRSHTREAVRRHRARKAEGKQESQGKPCKPKKAYAEAEAEAEAEADPGLGAKAPLCSSSTKPPRYPVGFLAAWAAYPHHATRSKKAAAGKVWATRKLEPEAERVLTWIHHAAATDDWQRQGGQFVPGMQAWLRGHDFSESPPKAAPRFTGEACPSGRHPVHVSMSCDVYESEGRA